MIDPSVPSSHRLAKDGKEGDSFDWLLLAMAHQRLRHSDEAKTFHGKAKLWITAFTKVPPFDTRVSWLSWLELQLLNREAEALVNPKPDKS